MLLRRRLLVQLAELAGRRDATRCEPHGILERSSKGAETMKNTDISWTIDTHNITYGCSKVSAGCRNCYAERTMGRLKGNAESRKEKAQKLGRLEHALDVLDDRNRWNGQVNVIDGALDEILRWRKPRLVFVNSLSDLFHESLSEEFITRAFRCFGEASRHVFQILTKRSERLIELDSKIDWPKNVWMGVSVENEHVIDRIDHLQQTNAIVKWLSVEPMLGPLGDPDLTDIDWIVAGGESGRSDMIRPLDADWVRSLRDASVAKGIPFFFKQWGHDRNNPSQEDPTSKRRPGGWAKGGCQIDGFVWEQMPQALSKELTGAFRKQLKSQADEPETCQAGAATQPAETT